MEHLITHQDKNYMAIPNRIKRHFQTYLKKEKIKRDERIKLTESMYQMTFQIAQAYYQKIDGLVGKMNDNEESYYKLLEFSNQVDNQTLKSFVQNNITTIPFVYTSLKNNNKLKNVILENTMLYMIEDKGAYFGPMYAFLFARTYDLSLDYVMQYGYSEDIKSQQLFNQYYNFGGSMKIICLPYYFTDDKSKYNMEDLSQIIKEKKESEAIKKYLKSRYK